MVDFSNLRFDDRAPVYQQIAEYLKRQILLGTVQDGNPFTAHFDAGCGMAVDMITGAPHDFGGGSELAPYSVSYWKMER